MKTNNPKIIGLVMLIVGLGVLYIWGSALYKTIVYPTTGTTKQAKVIGYKVSHNGARMVKNSTKISGRGPFFEFISDENTTIKSYSNAPQLFILFNYEINEKIKVAYPNNNPEKAIIISWKEIPGLLLMIGFGILMLVVGKNYLLK
jgi:hypothetical protein